MSPKKVIITRPLHDAVPLAEQIEQKGGVPFVEPLVHIQPINTKIPDLSKYRALVFTSANGVRCFTGQSDVRALPVYTAGRDTARVAIEYGFDKINCADGGAAGIEKMMADDEILAGTDGTVLHLSGADIAREIAVPGIEVERLALYKAVLADRISDRMVELMMAGEAAHIMFFSARTAQAFVDLLHADGRTDAVKPIKALCISDSVVKCVRDLPWQDVQAADRPDGRGMIALWERSL